MTIHEQIRNDDLQAIEDLLNSDRSFVNKPDERGFTPLVLSTYLGKIEVAKLLLSHGADINAVDAMAGNTALMGVCFKGSYDLAKMLISHGADISIRNRSGETALDFATKGGHQSIVDLLKGTT
ncbi:MAG: ankyrin repeat domain-containing protein [Bacteroidota bacterium]